MNQPVGPDGRGLRYASTLDCLGKSVRAEGVLSLWKGPAAAAAPAAAAVGALTSALSPGFWPNYCRLGPHVVITFVVLEQLRALAR